MLSFFVTIALACAPAVARNALVGEDAETRDAATCDVTASDATAWESTAREPAAQSYDPVAHLRAWLKLAHDGRATIDRRSISEIKSTIGDLRTVWAINPPRAEEVTIVLLDFLGFCLAQADLADAETDEPRIDAQNAAADALKQHWDSDLRTLLARKVLALPHSQPAQRRLAAAWLAIDAHAPEMKLALFGCAKDADPRLRSVALQALSGWDDEGVHQLFLHELEQWFAGNPRADARRAEAHFKAVNIAPGSRVLTELAAIVKPRLASTDWRAVSQAVALSRPLEHATVVPFLIEALATWKKRADTGAQGLRVEFEILRALEARSGRKLGPAPESWRDWWASVERGDVRGQTPHTTGGAPEPTRASFFGLKPVTDRVTFVIDRSGSMDSPFAKAPPKDAKNPTGTGTHAKNRSRWDEAVDELIGFVEGLGEKARFNVIVFHDFAESWKPRLADATKENRKAARDWLAMHHPGGGTQLRAGIDRAMSIDAAGEPDLTLLEADTVIVLCDGATAEGPEWVDGFMQRANAIARVLFDCVEIGHEGDGTLPRLARGSGGEYVRIDG
jgi:hypothetical protein